MPSHGPNDLNTILNENKLEMNFKPNKHELYLFNREKERKNERNEKDKREKE